MTVVSTHFSQFKSIQNVGLLLKIASHSTKKAEPQNKLKVLKARADPVVD